MIYTLTSFVFFFNDTATTEIYTLSLHDALPIYFLRSLQPACRLNDWTHSLSRQTRAGRTRTPWREGCVRSGHRPRGEDRKSTRLNSSHANISYAVFCLKKKKKEQMINSITGQRL